jgi:hypothetical protein
MALRKLEDSADHNDLDVFGRSLDGMWDVGSYELILLIYIAKKTKEGERWKKQVVQISLKHLNSSLFRLGAF